MYDFFHPASCRAPLDFNTPRNTDTVVDALNADPGPHDSLSASGLDTAALLAELGLSAQAMREIRTRRSAPDV